MLRTLSIENIAVIKQAEIEFCDSFNILTGETGAGKSVLIGSLNAILGARISKDIIRYSCDSASVSAIFDGCSAALKQKLGELGVLLDDDELLITRTISVDGKSQVHINGKPVTLAILKELAPLLINIHGQHENQLLMNPANHVVYLDRMGNLQSSVEAYKAEFRELVAIKKQIDKYKTDTEERKNRLELLGFQIKELEDADIRVGERDELNARRNKIINSEKIAKLLGDVLRQLGAGDQKGIIDQLSDTSHSLSKSLTFLPEAQEDYDKLDEISYELRDVYESVSSKLEAIDYSESESAEIEERLDALYRLSGKYGKTEEDMLRYLDSAREEYEKLNNCEADLSGLEKDFEQKKIKVFEKAKQISAERHKASELFIKSVISELEFLNMPNVTFDVGFESTPLTVNGLEKIEFLISVNKGEPLKALSKVASGGELSRIMLAVKKVLAEYDDVDTLVFDEIDTGISGRAADKVGQKLYELGTRRQVICVTHLAQIASKADRHLLIEKTDNTDSTVTNIIPLDFEGRKQELARIIGGQNITQKTLANAEELLNEK